MSHSPRFVSPTTFARLVIALGLATASCAQPKVDSSAGATTAAVTAATTGASPGKLDVLFMIDDSSSMTSMQQKFAVQIPAFVTALENLPTGLPDIHIAVVSSDMGAPGDSTFALGCTLGGDEGQFRAGTASGIPLDRADRRRLAVGNDAGAPGCATATLNAGATFISDVGGVANYTGDLATLLSCMTVLGDKGCGFENQLASVARALGADGSPAPATNAGFLRPDAQLAIIVLSNEDDCSAPANTQLYSLNGGQQNLENPLGPIANYRCNQFGHLCVDPSPAAAACLTQPPLQPPHDVQVTASGVTLSLTDCASDDSNGLLTPVKTLVSGIRALKADPDNQIVVGAIVAPPTPYTVAWVPEQGGQNTQPGELWPVVEHSCGPGGGDDVNPRSTQPTTDGTFGDPAVRIAQWVRAFGANGVVASICDGNYGSAFSAIASKIGAHLPGGAGIDAGTVQGATDPSALPICPNAIGAGPTNGLSNGGCTCGVEPGPASLWTLLLLGTLLAFAGRRRAR